VRNGTKWADNVHAKEPLRIVRTEGEEPTGEIVNVEFALVTKKEFITDSWLKYEHDPDCRTIEGLTKAMDKAYPDGWGPEITLLFFQFR
jgi:hypothetical protein